MLDRDECYKCINVIDCYLNQSHLVIKGVCTEGDGSEFVEATIEQGKRIIEALVEGITRQSRVIRIYEGAHNNVRQRLADELQ